MNLKKYANIISQKYGIPKGIFQALITAESAWDPNARSGSGAIGLTQVMPNTAKALGFEPSRLARDPLLQLEAGAKYLSSMYELFKSWDHALAAYNAGPHNVKKYDGVPPFKETRNYVRRVLTLALEYDDSSYDPKKDETTIA